jgi:hypothetical protein
MKRGTLISARRSREKSAEYFKIKLTKLVDNHTIEALKKNSGCGAVSEKDDNNK